MRTYDLYLFAEDQKLIIGWHRFDADNDEVAVEVSEALTQQRPLELWAEDKLIKRWDDERRP